MEIRTIGDPILREHSSNITLPYNGLMNLIDSMARTMYDAPGVGLAANQIGVLSKICVIDVGEGMQTLINPRLIKGEGELEEEEGCLSVPGIVVPVKRFEHVIVEAQSEEGETITIDAEGLLARVLQHEIDHLEGKLLLDRIDVRARREIMHELNERMGLI